MCPVPMEAMEKLVMEVDGNQMGRDGLQQDSWSPANSPKPRKVFCQHRMETLLHNFSVAQLAMRWLICWEDMFLANKTCLHVTTTMIEAIFVCRLVKMER